MDDFVIAPPNLPNFEIEMGKDTSIRFAFNERRTLIKRLKWWLFCLFFPFKVVRWDKGGLK